jgi:hypothetical protein
MADTGSLFSFFSDPGGNTNYPALEMRRKIALAMLAQNSRKGYPKTLGEGLSAVGDAIGEGMTYRRLMAQEAAYQRQLEKEAPGMVPGEARPGPQSAAEPATTTAAADDENPVIAAVTPPEAPPETPPPQETPPETPPQAPPAAPLPRQQAYIIPPPAAPSPAPPAASPAAALSPEAMQAYAARRATSMAPGRGLEPPNADTQSTRFAGAFDPYQPAPGFAPGQVGSRPSYAPADAVADARLADVTGMKGGPTGAYSYAPTASRSGDIQSDAPPITGISPGVGAAAADTMQQRDDIARELLMQPNRAPVPGVPQPNPTQQGATISLPGGGPNPQLAQAQKPGVVTDIMPAPTAPLTGLPQRPTPPPVVTAPPDKPVQPQDPPMSEDEKRGYRMLALHPGDPNYAEAAKNMITYGAAQRKQEYDARMRAYEAQLQLYNQQVTSRETFERGAPERELERKAKEIEIAKAGAFGGLDQGKLFEEIGKSHEMNKSIPMAQMAIQNARQAALEGKMFTGSAAETNLSLKKIMSAAGFPTDPRINATEEFRAMISPVLASARQALVGGANISDSDMNIAKAAVGGDIKLDRTSIISILGALERINTATAVSHQKKLETMAGDDPQRQAALFGVYGLPMENVVPRQAIDLLRSQPTPEVITQFNKKYRTPGLAQSILGGR